MCRNENPSIQTVDEPRMSSTEALGLNVAHHACHGGNDFYASLDATLCHHRHIDVGYLASRLNTLSTLKSPPNGLY